MDRRGSSKKPSDGRGLVAALGLLVTAVGALAAWFGLSRSRRASSGPGSIDQPAAPLRRPGSDGGPTRRTAPGPVAVPSPRPETDPDEPQRADDGTAYGPNGAGEDDDRPSAVADVSPGPVMVLHLVPGETGWQLKQEGDDDPIDRFATKKSGLDAARRLAREREPSRLVVHRLDGTIQNQFTYGEQ